MKIMLLQSPVATWSPHAFQSPPLGLAYIARYLIDEGHTVRITDLNLSGFREARITSLIKHFRPDIVGISAYTESYNNALLIAELVKNMSPHILVVMGGAHASAAPEMVVSNEQVDHVIVGEGEISFCEIAKALESFESHNSISKIPGVVSLIDGEIIKTAPRPSLDVDAVKYPSRDLLPLEFYPNQHNIVVARGGCPYRCPFCSASYLWGSKQTRRSIQSILEEIEFIERSYDTDSIYFIDDILTVHKAWTYSLLEALIKRPCPLIWGGATRVDCVDKPMLIKMAEAGCDSLQFGIESGSQAVLDSVKGIDKEQAFEAVKAALDCGIKVSCSFMVPFPQDTFKSIAETFVFMERLQDIGARLLVSYTTPFPGTMFYDEREKLGLELLSDNWDEYDCQHLVWQTDQLKKECVVELVTSSMAKLGLQSF